MSIYKKDGIDYNVDEQEQIEDKTVTRGEIEELSSRTPKNMNNVYTDKFKLVFKKLPTTTFFCYSLNIPGVGINVLKQATPYNNLNLGGNKVDYEDLTVQFRVDINLLNYQEIKDWITGIGAPKDSDEYINLINSDKLGRKGGYNIYSDSTMIILTNQYNYNIKVVFRDCFPIRLGGIEFDMEKNEALSASATFKYKYYDIETSESGF